MTWNSPECCSLHLRLALHTVDHLRTKDDFEILFSPARKCAARQLFQACFVSEKFAGRPGSAARNPCRYQNDLAGGLVSEAGGYRIVFDNLPPWSQSADLPCA